MSNQSAGLILRTRLGAIICYAASLIGFYYVHLGSCATWVSAELGYLPMHIVMSTIVIVMLYWYMPKDPDEQDQVLQVKVCLCFLLQRTTRRTGSWVYVVYAGLIVCVLQ